MSTTPTAIIHSASPRPYARLRVASMSVSPTGSLPGSSFGIEWVCDGHMSIEHNPVTATTTGSKRLGPGSFVGVLT
jgi:hypothetical protein